MGLRFISSDESMQSHGEFKGMLNQSNVFIQMAFAYFTKAGWALIESHLSSLSHEQSFLVVSIDTPTDLDSLSEVARHYPGKVFLHLGWITPHERKVGAGLMHSKIALGRSFDRWWLWVGSQNLTARAMVGGNMEAALIYDCSDEENTIIDARDHLRRCRDGAEMFDLERIAEYKQLQAKATTELGIREKVLVIFAEEHEPIASFPAVIHVRIQSESYDDLIKTGGEAHIILVQPGTLHPGVEIPLNAKRYTGKIIEDNRTELHSLRGSASTMPAATHWLEIGSAPKLIAPNSIESKPLTQAAIKIEARLGAQQPSAADEYIYSVAAARGKIEATAMRDRVVRRDIPADMLHFYSQKSRNGNGLVFAPRESIIEIGQVTVYRGTPIPSRFVEVLARSRVARHRAALRQRRDTQRIELKIVERVPENLADPFFFRTEFLIRSDDSAIE